MSGSEILNSWNEPTGIYIDIVITKTDTVVIWSKYKSGSVIIDRKPVKAE